MAAQIVNSYDEWTQLHEAVVGHNDGFTGFHLDNSFNLFYWENVKSFLSSKNYYWENGKVSWPIIPIEQKILDELDEDIHDFVHVLQNLNVTIRRPVSSPRPTHISTPYWESNVNPPLNVRDQTLILGANIIETSPHVRSRIFENDGLKPLFYEYISRGARWVNMPRPTLSANILDPSYFQLTEEEEHALADYYAKAVPGLNTEIVFDGAQCIRLGKDVLVNVANKNHQLGLDWLKSNFGTEFVFHKLNGLADSHIDSMLLPLRPGLWLIRAKAVLDFLPPKFQKWDYIIAPEPKHDLFPSYASSQMSIASKFIDMNILTVNENTIIANSLYPELVSLLEKRGFTVAQVRHRHRRLFGGGFHCFSLDIKRAGGLEDYGQ